MRTPRKTLIAAVLVLVAAMAPKAAANPGAYAGDPCAGVFIPAGSPGCVDGKALPSCDSSYGLACNKGNPDSPVVMTQSYSFP